ncbi:beta-galactosidase [Microbacterium excoecariae]|uniref:beta-galactosidase n=1 Tax=Microbacterium excoecariae TaxID=2715210 RepID=UPI00140A4B2F|nr:beta-galactosidase [Microbacterium excoecariae]NHI15643.1 hypothetical protein [Microbacterium excoecariae]
MSGSAPLCIRPPRAADAAPAPLDMGGGGIAVRQTHLERDGRPWFPVMGEYHFSRDRPENWRAELAKMRAGGVSVVATYALWILHEEVRGEVRFDGPRDLRRFVDTAREVGLDVVLRVGPWAHGETRNGGFPDWVQALPIAHRTDDPAYLELVRGWFAALAGELRGLAWGDPIVGVQVDNELYDQPGHLATLRRMAEEAGIGAPLWTATGWGGAQLPARAVLPVYAGYSDGFWEEAETGWPAFGRTHFAFSAMRDDLTVGADVRAGLGAATARDSAAGPEPDPWPFATCELGGGMTVAYHRRPLVDPEDVAALAVAKLGSGSAWQGFYMFHGGRHPIGRTTTQESQATGYPNDVPVTDYDFFAPIGSEGQLRPHFHALRAQHLALAQYGADLAPLPAVIPADPRLRASLRGDDRGGWLFLGNHQPAAEPLPGVPGAQVRVELAAGAVTLPSRPVDLPAGATAWWPVRRVVGGIRLSATAQALTEVAGPDGPVVFLGATAGVPVELHVDAADARRVLGAAVRDRGADGAVALSPDAEPGPGCEVRIGETTFVVLDPASAAALWRGEVAGRDTAIVWEGSAWFDGGLHVVAPAADATLLAWPPLGDLPAEPGGSSVLARHAIAADPRAVTPIAAPRLSPVTAPVRAGGSAGRLSAPTDDDFAALAPARLEIPDDVFDGADRAILRLEWTGDAIRLTAGGALLADQFWSGRPLEVDLAPHRAAIARHGLEARAFAWDPSTRVHVDPRVRPRADAPVLEVTRAEVRSERIRVLR